MAYLAGDTLPAADLNVPTFVGYATSAQSMDNGAFESVDLGLEAIDTHSGHSTVSATSRYVAQVAGYYLCGGLVTFAANATGQRGARLAKNGTGIDGTAVLMPNNGGTFIMAVPTPIFVVELAVNDYIEVQGFQNSGSGLNTATAAGWYPSLSVCWQRPV